MTLTEFLSKHSMVLEVDLARVPEGIDVNKLVEILVGFNVLGQTVPPIVIKDTRENREIVKKDYDQP